MSVSIAPGDIEFTVMPRLPNKAAFGRRIGWNAVKIHFLRHPAVCTASHRSNSKGRAISVRYTQSMKWLTLALAVAVLAFSQSAPKQSEVRKITDAEDLAQLLKNDKNMFFLDVREPKEIEDLGSLKGYVNIPLGELEKRMKEVPKNRTIITA